MESSLTPDLLREAGYTYLLDWPFDDPGHTPVEDHAKVDGFLARSDSTRTLVWLPAFFALKTQAGLGKLVILDHLLRLDLAHRHEERGQGGQPEPRRGQHAVFAVAREEERRMRRLRGPRTYVESFGRMEAALEVERHAAPALPHQRDAFLDARPAVVTLGLERLVILQRATTADADVEPSIAHHVQRGQLLGEVDRVVLLGDVLELRHGPVREALTSSREFFEELGAVMAQGEIVISAGNHDHGLVEPWLIARGQELEPPPLGVQQLFEPTAASPALAQIAGLRGGRLRMASFPTAGATLSDLDIEDTTNSTTAQTAALALEGATGENLTVFTGSADSPGDAVDVKDTAAGKVLADDKGMTLYTFDDDGKGKSSCYDDCAKGWPPFTAAADAKAEGKWTIVDRTEFGLNWNAPLPKGGLAVANDVKLTVELELVQS